MSNIVIKVKNVSKIFKIPHNKIDSVRSAFVNAFKSKNYEEFKALDDVSFEVEKGEFFGIIGRNGSGKSTLLKTLASIYQPDSGTVKVKGLISPFLELGIGFNPELSGRDNVYLNATVLGMTEKEIDKKFDSIVQFSELERFIDQKLKKYSSGMQVRLAFAVSIHANRDILLMDEVLAVGDDNFQSKCLEEFNKYRDMGRTVIIVTHDVSVVERYCDRAMLLQDGKIVKIGKADKVVCQYIENNMSEEEKRLRDEEKKERKRILVETVKREREEKKAKRREMKRERREVELVKRKRKKTEKIRIEKEKMKRRVEIVDVEFLDKEGNKKNVFKTGDEISIKVIFKRNEINLDSLNIGLGLYSDNNNYVFGYNTQMDNFVIEKSKNEVFLKFNEFTVLKGNYFLRAVCFGDDENNFFDFVDKVAYLKIFSSVETFKYRGLVSINHLWKNNELHKK